MCHHEPCVHVNIDNVYMSSWTMCTCQHWQCVCVIMNHVYSQHWQCVRVIMDHVYMSTLTVCTCHHEPCVHVNIDSVYMSSWTMCTVNIDNVYTTWKYRPCVCVVIDRKYKIYELVIKCMYMFLTHKSICLKKISPFTLTCSADHKHCTSIRSFT